MSLPDRARCEILLDQAKLARQQQEMVLTLTGGNTTFDQVATAMVRLGRPDLRSRQLAADQSAEYPVSYTHLTLPTILRV